MIVHYTRCANDDSAVVVSESRCPSTLEEATTLAVPRSVAITSAANGFVVNIPTSRRDLEVLRRVNSWPERLASLGLAISTGPVVPFRTDSLREEPELFGTLPLLWLQHVSVGRVIWPRVGLKKPQFIRSDADHKLLVPNKTYVLLRRFSAKEDARRLTAAVLDEGSVPGDRVGLENHLNYIHAKGKGLRKDLAHGLTAFFSLDLVDRYFAISNGNTQVSASEIRRLPLPPQSELERLGRLSQELGLDTVYGMPEVQRRLEEVLP